MTKRQNDLILKSITKNLNVLKKRPQKFKGLISEYEEIIRIMRNGDET